MGKITEIRDSRKERITKLLMEAKREKPKNMEKIYKLREQLIDLKAEEYMG